jgi:hypothetical protein
MYGPGVAAAGEELLTGLEVAVGMLIGWFARRARHVGERVDEKVDEALDKGLDKVHDLITGKLHDEPALKVLEGEVVDTGEATTRTRSRVRLALEEAVETDDTFAADLTHAVREVQANAPAGISITGGVSATQGGIAIGGITGGTVSFGREDPPKPARP